MERHDLDKFNGSRKGKKRIKCIECPNKLKCICPSCINFYIPKDNFIFVMERACIHYIKHTCRSSEYYKTRVRSNGCGRFIEFDWIDKIKHAEKIGQIEKIKELIYAK